MKEIRFELHFVRMVDGEAVPVAFHFTSKYDEKETSPSAVVDQVARYFRRDGFLAPSQLESKQGTPRPSTPEGEITAPVCDICGGIMKMSKYHPKNGKGINFYCSAELLGGETCNGRATYWKDSKKVTFWEAK